MLRKNIAKMGSAPDELIGLTGCRYRFKELIQERPSLGRVWLATSENPRHMCATTRKLTSIRSGKDQFILKDIPHAIFSNFNEKIRPQLRESRYLRLPWDTIPGQRVFVYKYLTDDFLSLVRKQIPMRVTKQILKDSLRGIAELHDQHIVHLGNLFFCIYRA
jgi:hypothetical protein